MAEVLRLIATIALIVGVYLETGWATGLAMSFMAIRLEMDAIMLVFLKKQIDRVRNSV